MRLSNVIFCLATAVVVTAQSDAQSDREGRGVCLVQLHLPDRGPVLLLLHLQGDADGCPDDGDGEPDVALDV